MRYNGLAFSQNFIHGRHFIMKGAIRNAAIIAAVVLVVLIIGIILAAIFHVLLDVLYIFLMLLAALMVVGTLLQVLSIISLMRTISTVREEVKPLLASVQETVGIVKDTAQTASHSVKTVSTVAQLTGEIALAPSVRTVAAVVAGQGMLRVFFGKGQTRTRSEKRRKEQLKAIEAVHRLHPDAITAGALGGVTVEEEVNNGAYGVSR